MPATSTIASRARARDRGQEGVGTSAELGGIQTTCGQTVQHLRQRRLVHVLGQLRNATDADISRSSGLPVVFGDTSTGRHLMVVYEEIDPDTVYPVTAYDVPRRKRP